MFQKIKPEEIDFVSYSFDISVLATYREKFWGGLSYRQSEAVIAILGINLLKDKLPVTVYKSPNIFSGKISKINKVADCYYVLECKKVLNDMIDDVFKIGGEPPVNKIRKVIFKDYSMLTINEKLSIVGKLIGRSSRVDDEAIYQCMLDLNDLGKHICIGRIAGLLNVSKRTIYRHINDELKQEIKILNEEI